MIVAALTLAPIASAELGAQVAAPAGPASAEWSASRSPAVPTHPRRAAAASTGAERGASAPLSRARTALVAFTVPGTRPSRAPWWAPIASGIAPGAGQAALGQDRWLAFAALEATALLRYAADRGDAQRERRAYRRLANQVARALYTTGSPPTGGFEYYESMEKWVESGVYDAQPGGVLDPETDESTFNGAIWLLARQTYWSDPDTPPVTESIAYRSSISFYERRAVRPDFRWSWRDAQLEQDLYRRAIERSNDAFQRASQDLAAVIANHVLSTVDAYVTLRLRRRPGPAGDEAELGATLPWPRRRAPR